MRFSEYGRVAFFCGDNYDRGTIRKVNASLGRDADLWRIIKFRRTLLLRYRIYGTLKYIIGSCVVISILSNVDFFPFLSKYLQVPPQVIGMLTILGILAEVLPKLSTDPLEKYFSDVQQELGIRKGNEYKVKNSGARRKSFRDFISAIEHDFPRNPGDCWRLIEGHISDACVAPYMHYRANGIPISMVYCGEPYYSSLFIDSIYLRIISKNQSLKGQFLNALKKNNKIHFIKYLQLWLSGSHIDFENNRLNHSTYVYGLTYLSRLLSLLLEEWGCQKLNVQINIGAQNSNGETKNSSVKSQALDYIFRAASCPEYLEIVEGTENGEHDPIIEVVDISLMNEDKKGGSRYFDRRKGVFRIPIKKPIFVNNSKTKALNPALVPSRQGDRSLIMVIGGAEQNFAAQMLINENFWRQTKNERFLGINENLFSEAPLNIGTENLVYSIWRNIETANIASERTEREPTDRDKRVPLSALVYFIKDANIGEESDIKKDVIGVYGHNALATNIFAMYMIHILTQPPSQGKNELEELSLKANRAMFLEITIRDSGSKFSETKQLIEFWDATNAINNFSKFQEFLEEIKVNRRNSTNVN